MDGRRAPARPLDAIATGFRSLLRPPFATIYLLALVVALVTASLSGDESTTGALSALLLGAVSIYLQIAVVLAAGTPEPGRSADAWIRAALRRRCFLRYLGATLVATLCVAAGALGLVVGAFVVGAFVGLAQPVAVLERPGPVEAVKRSVELSRPARKAVGIVFGALLLAPLAILLFIPADRHGTAGAAIAIAVGVIGSTLSIVASIALTELYLALGGSPAPGPGEAARLR